MELLGRGGLILALVLALWAVYAGVRGARMRDRRLQRSGERAIVAMAGAVLCSSLVLWIALLRHDFRFAAVADYTSRDLGTGYTLSAFWASQPGSLLLWMLVLALLSAVVVWQNRSRNRELMPWVVAVLGGICAFFAFLLVVVASPFETLPLVPTDGVGLNPSLQNPYMMAHPPFLYLGYVGFGIPFAFAMGALLAGRVDERWITTTRRWTIVAWTSLAVGMVLGAHWAYEEIGWGGFWAWDPVENAALIPWLVGTAFLHSVIVQEKKGMLKIWNVSLISLTYVLCLFGTFLTRSGVLNSVHAFIESAVGPWFLAFIAVVALASTLLIVRSVPLLRSPHRIESVVSREASFLFNNLLLVAFAFAVLWGVLFPTISETLRGTEIAISTPYYDFFAVALGLPLLLMAGIGPVVAWRRASLAGVARAFRWAFLSAASAAALLVVLGFGSSVPGVVALSLCLFVAVTIVLELARGTRARRALDPELAWPRAFAGLIARNRRRYGGYIVHLAVVIAVIGIVGTSAYSTSAEQTLGRGESMQVRDYTLTLTGVERVRTGNAIDTRAVLALTRDGKPVATMRPAKRFFETASEQTNEVAIRSSLRTGEDLFVILDGVTRTGEARIKALVNPLVNLIWLGGLLLVFGASIAIWPDARLARRLARRDQEAHAGAVAAR